MKGAEVGHLIDQFVIINIIIDPPVFPLEVYPLFQPAGTGIMSLFKHLNSSTSRMSGDITKFTLIFFSMNVSQNLKGETNHSFYSLFPMSHSACFFKIHS